MKAIRRAYDTVPESADYVMYWWNHAAQLVADGMARRSGLITTNSITQTFNNRVVSNATASGNAHLAFACPDHPWVDSSDGADVRIAMTTVAPGNSSGILVKVESEGSQVCYVARRGSITSSLKLGPDLSRVRKLKANRSLACPGVQLSGKGFVLSSDEVRCLGDSTRTDLVKRYVTGRDLTQKRREQFVIDTAGLSEQDLLARYPDAYQRLFERVKPDRDQNPRAKYRREWWLHSEPRKIFRASLFGLSRCIVTSRTSRHRFFEFLDMSYLPETKVLIFSMDSAFALGILSSRVHTVFSNATGGWLGVGNDSTYNHSVCFECFPFPALDVPANFRISQAGEQLDTHRKRQLETHGTLTMTNMYNILEKLRLREPLNAKDRMIHEQGLVSVLKQIHDDLDTAVFDAYGWPHDLSDEEILERLVELNHERAEEESRGIIRWLRPDFQAPTDAASQTTINMGEEPAKPKPKKPVVKLKKHPWPKTLPERVRAVRDVLAEVGTPSGVDAVSARFNRAPKPAIGELLDTLVAVGQARQLEDGRYVP